jgi:anti-anti-sigma factor
MSGLADLSVVEKDGVPVARIAGEVDASNTAGVLRDLLRAVSNQAMGMVLDLTTTTYLDSSGVQLVFDLSERLRARQQGLRIVLADDSLILDVLRVTKLVDLIPIDPTVDSAAAALKADSLNSASG